MTFEELKREAKAQGYHLIKSQPHIKFEPCICGCNRREHWTKWTGVESLIMLRCAKCGREASGKTEKDAKLNWNSMIQSLDMVNEGDNE